MGFQAGAFQLNYQQGSVAPPVYGWRARTRIGSRKGRDPFTRIGSSSGGRG